MKKRIRQMVSVAFVFVMALSLIACGSESGGASGDDLQNIGTDQGGDAAGEDSGTSGELQLEFDAGDFKDLGTMGITFDGTRYAAQAYQNEEGEIFVSTGALERLFGKEAKPLFVNDGTAYASQRRVFVEQDL